MGMIDPKNYSAVASSAAVYDEEFREDFDNSVNTMLSNSDATPKSNSTTVPVSYNGIPTLDEVASKMELYILGPLRDPAIAYVDVNSELSAHSKPHL